MYCVIQTKGVDEPWWMMDDWKEMIVLEESCSTLEEAKELYKQLVETYTNQYEKKREKHFSCAFWDENECEYIVSGEDCAFWNEEEQEYCVPCEEYLQIYYGVLILTPEGKLYSEGE